MVPTLFETARGCICGTNTFIAYPSGVVTNICNSCSGASCYF